MRVVILLILLVLTGLAMPEFVAAGFLEQTLSDIEPGSYSLFEQIDSEEEQLGTSIGKWMTGLSSCRATLLKFRPHLQALTAFPPPPRSV